VGGNEDAETIAKCVENQEFVELLAREHAEKLLKAKAKALRKKEE